MHTALPLQRLLNRKRLAYAWIAGGAVWIAWLVSMVLGPGNVDLAGHVIGADYLQFYTAGYTLRLGESPRLYEFDYQSQLQRELIGPQLRSYHAFITPPFLAWLYVPFAALPYRVSFVAWSLLGLLGLWISIHLLGTQDPRWAFGWSLTWYPVFATFSFGQNAWLSLVLLSLIYWLWRKERLWAAGMACSLLMYKPQLTIGVGLLWLLEWRRQLPALLGLILGSSILACLSFWKLPAASWAYLEFARTILPNLPDWHDFPLWYLHTVRGFWRLLLPQHPAWADGLTLLLAALGVLGFLLFWRRYRRQDALLFAGAICFTLWVTPHAMIYDWTLLLIPAVLLWREVPQFREAWKTLFAWVWLVGLLSWMLTLAQLQVLPFAVQISVPVLLLVIYLAYRWLLDLPLPDHHWPQFAKADATWQSLT
ncbi:MAG: glycosyltransferase family 87 protein [Anaerolineae bacterium]